MTGLKHDAGKTPLHLLPPRPLFEVAEVLGFGARKYGEHNWCAGFAASRLFGAALRHLWAWWAGEDDDPESGCSHLAHAMCCLLFLLDLQRSQTIGWRDDRPAGRVVPIASE